jgi:hypothetical protein
MHPTYPTECAYVEPKSGRVSAPDGRLLPHHVDYGLERINQEVSAWIRGERGAGGAGTGGAPVHVSGKESIVWARDYSSPDGRQCDCSVLEAALGKLPGMKRVVVGRGLHSSTFPAKPEPFLSRNNPNHPLIPHNTPYMHPKQPLNAPLPHRKRLR